MLSYTGASGDSRVCCGPEFAVVLESVGFQAVPLTHAISQHCCQIQLIVSSSKAVKKTPECLEKPPKIYKHYLDL